MDESRSDLPSVPPNTGRVSAGITRSLDRETAWRACVRRIAARDQSGLSALYDESSPIVFGLAVRVLGSPADAEEITSDVFTQVWRTAASYEESRGSVLSWLATMARTRAIDRLRSRGAAVRHEEPLTSLNDVLSDNDAESAAVSRLDRRRVLGAVATLSAEQQQVLRLAYFSGMSHSEIAEHLHMPIGTVKTRIRLGLIRLREIMEEKQ